MTFINTVVARRLVESAPLTTVTNSNTSIYASQTQGAPASGRALNVWTLTGSNGQIVRNGVIDASTSNVVQIYYVYHTVYQQNTANNWWYWSGSAWVSTSSPLPQAAVRASRFIDSLGINIHINFGAPNANTTTLTNALNYIGVHNVRDAIPDTGLVSTYQTVMTAGIKFNLQCTGQVFNDPNAFASKLSVVDTLVQSNPGSVISIESFNEPANWPITYNGTTSPASCQAAAQTFYSAVRADANLNGIPVIDLSEGYYYNATQFQSMSGRAEYANVHNYPQSGTTPNNPTNIGASISSEFAVEYSSPPTNKVITEIGYFTETDSSGGTSSDPVWTPTTNALQGNLILLSYLNGFYLGFYRTFVYDLFDDFTGSSAANDYFGVFNNDGTAKTAATNIQNLTTLLNDAGGTANTFTPGGLAFKTNNFSGDKTILLQMSNGTYWLAVWNDAGTSHTFTLTLGLTATAIAVYDPIGGTSATQIVNNTSSLSVALSADPLLISVTM